MNTPLQTYRVHRGDTLTDIARQHGVTPEALMRANHLDPRLADGRVSAHAHDPDRLLVGQRLVIPVATPGLEREHHVAAGETLLGIAERWGVSLKELVLANPLLQAAERVIGLLHDPHAAPPAPAGAASATPAPAAGTAGIDLQHFTDPALGSNAPAAIVIGSAEGTRRPDGGFRAAYGGHTDPGNAAHNRGSFSYQHPASGPADADRRQLLTLREQLPAYEAAARQAGLNPADARLASAYLDLFNQSPKAAERFLGQLGALRGQPLDAAYLAELRFHSYVDAATGERFRTSRGGQAGSGFVTIARNQLHREPTEAEVQAVIRADQQRRTQAVETALGRQGLLTPSAAAPARPASATTASTPAPATQAAPSAAPRWLDIARGELGVHEIRGSRNEPRVVEYHQATTLRAQDDETSWCSAFVNWTMQQAGVQGTHSAAARSWLHWGQAVPMDAAHVKPGDVIVFPRGNNPNQGHVAIVSQVLPNGRVEVVGGNQSVRGQDYDGVTLSIRQLSSAIGVRRAP